MHIFGYPAFFMHLDIIMLIIAREREMVLIRIEYPLVLLHELVDEPLTLSLRKCLIWLIDHMLI